MGCMSSSIEKYYEFSTNDEEKSIRDWERKMGFFRNSFGNIYPILITDERVVNNSELLKTLIKRNYSDNFLNEVVLNKKLQKDGQIDAQKLKDLVFLSTIHIECVTGSKAFCDKASFLFSEANKDEEIEANYPIERNNIHLMNFISDLYDMSCIILPEVYLKLAGQGREEVYTQFKNQEIKKDIISFFIKDLFTSKDGAELNTLSFDELNTKFLKSPNIFTSGFIRAEAYAYLKSPEYTEKQKNNS